MEFYEKLKTLFYDSLYQFIKNNKSHFELDASERAWNTSFAIEMFVLKKLLGEMFEKNYYVDTEYNRQGIGNLKKIVNHKSEIINITCDLILHSRGEQTIDNLIAIEFKKYNNSLSEKIKDKTRLKALTTSVEDTRHNIYPENGTALPEVVCGYIVGFLMEIDSKNKLIFVEEYKNGKIVEVTKLSFSEAEIKTISKQKHF